MSKPKSIKAARAAFEKASTDVAAAGVHVATATGEPILVCRASNADVVVVVAYGKRMVAALESAVDVLDIATGRVRKELDQ